MKYSGKGLRQSIEESSHYMYTPLTIDTLHKFMLDLTRHKHRDRSGRFAKKVKIVLLNTWASGMKDFDKAVMDNYIAQRINDDIKNI